MISMISMRRFAAVLALAGAASVLFAACGDDDDADVAGATTVEVSMRDYSFIADRTSAPAGPVRFVATNDGSVEHELYVFRTDLDRGALPTADDGSVDEEGTGVELVAETDHLDPGKSQKITADLTPGEYVFVCNIVEESDGEKKAHYGLGMHGAFTVE